MTILEDSLTLNNLLKVYLFAFSVLMLRYMIFSGGAYLVFWIFQKDKLQKRRIQDSFPKPKKILQEVAYSVLTFAIFGFFAVFIYFSYVQGWSKIYLSIGESAWDWGYLVFSIAVLLFV